MGCISEADTFSFREEFCGLNFGDRRLNKRFVKVLESINRNPHGVVKRTQSSWADMMAAYRMLGNNKVAREEVLRAHREQTIARMSVHKRVLAVQDTSTICYSSLVETDGLGSIAMGAFGSGGKGLLVHTTYALTTAGTPLGLLDQTIWSRGIGDPAERDRWHKGIMRAAEGNFTQVVFVGDREADGTDLFATSHREDVDFVVRGKAELRKCESDKTVVEFVREQPLAGTVIAGLNTQKISKKGDKSRNRHRRAATLEIRFTKVQLRPGKAPMIGLPATAEERHLTAVLVEEVKPPKGFEPVSWLLFTNLPVTDLETAKEIADLYKVRWEIEIFHKLLKSACQVEKAQLEEAPRLKKLITILSIVAWRLHVLTKLQREEPNLPCTEVLTKIEFEALFIAIHKSRKLPKKPPTIKEAMLWIAKLGGFIGRKGDGQPGALTMWSGWIKLVHYTEMYAAMVGL
jgi:hypothetical protein